MDPFANDDFLHTRHSRFRSTARRIVTPIKRHGWCHSPDSCVLLSAVWILSSILTVLIPLIHRTIHVKKYREEYMKYYWEQEYQEYQEWLEENYQQYGNNYYYNADGMNQDENYEQDEQNERYFDVNGCKWWQFNCFSFFVNEQGEARADQEWQPNWYSGFSTSEEERREMENSLEQPGSLKFVYVWQILLFIGLVWYGLLVIRQNRKVSGLIVSLLVWANFAFLSMWLMADGSIVTDGYQVKRMGFYGQMSVLIFISNFWYLLHGLFFVIFFWLRSSFRDEKEQIEKAKVTQSS